jgi:nitrate reductase gamma subunit
MHALYELATGILLWAAFAIFILGSIFRIWQLISDVRKREPAVFDYWSWKSAFRSMFRWWILPFGSFNSRREQWMTSVTWLFHVSLILAPIFLLAHTIHWQEGVLGVKWWSFPEWLTDVMAWIVVLAGLHFAIRRITQAQVRYVTSWVDFVVLAIVVAPFATGIVAYHQWGDPLTWTTIHILTGELWLITIPFSRLSHVIWGWFVRGYTASEFQGVKFVRDY